MIPTIQQLYFSLAYKCLNYHINILTLSTKRPQEDNEPVDRSENPKIDESPLRFPYNSKFGDTINDINIERAPDPQLMIWYGNDATEGEFPFMVSK